MKKNKRTYEIERYCVYCENSLPILGGSEVLCSHRGVVGVRHCCRKFIYDPLKRVPKRKNLPNPGEIPDHTL